MLSALFSLPTKSRNYSRSAVGRDDERLVAKYDACHTMGVALSAGRPEYPPMNKNRHPVLELIDHYCDPDVREYTCGALEDDVVDRLYDAGLAAIVSHCLDGTKCRLSRRSSETLRSAYYTIWATSAISIDLRVRSGALARV